PGPGRLTDGDRRRKRRGRQRIASRSNWPSAGSSRTTSGKPRTPRLIAGPGSSYPRCEPRTLLVDRFDCTPVLVAGTRGYAFTGDGTFGGVLASSTWPTTFG